MRIALVVLLSGCALAQQPDVRLHLAVAGAARTFRVGEPIPVTLDFTATGPGVLRMDTDVRLRHLQRHGADVFAATPVEGWRDPLDHLPWKWDDGTRIGSGPPRANLDALHPVRIERDLNEFLVFSQPGHYTVKVLSTRVERLNLESNTIPLVIAARDEAWTARQFAEAKALLEKAAIERQPDGMGDPAQEDAQADAVRKLRYLDIQAAAEYLAALSGRIRRNDSEIEMALHASAFPAAAAAVMTRQMDEPKLGLTQSYMSLLEMLTARALQQQQGREPTQEERAALWRSLRARALEMGALKSPRAKAETYFYLYETERPATAGSIRDRLIEALPGAPEFVLWVMLDSNWRKIRDAREKLEPMLEAVARRSSTPAGLRVPGLALRRLAELNAAAAEEIVRSKLQAGDSYSDDARLLEFSLSPSPTLDRLLLEQYRKGEPVEARLARFASAAVKDEVWRAFEARFATGTDGSSACPTAVFAYFFRVDAEGAAHRLAELRKDGQARCIAPEVPGLERLVMSPGLELQLLVDARSTDAWVRAKAFRTLSEAGSAHALGPLMEALFVGGRQGDEAVFAILNGKRWFLTDATYARLKTVCSPDLSCREVERLQQESKQPYRLSSWNLHGEEGVLLMNHQFETLAAFGEFLGQFPVGTEFQWRTGGPNPRPEEVERRRVVGQLLAAHGMKLVE